MLYEGVLQGTVQDRPSGNEVPVGDRRFELVLDDREELLARSPRILEHRGAQGLIRERGVPVGVPFFEVGAEDGEPVDRRRDPGGVALERVGDQLNLVMPGNITFNTDSYQLRADFYPVLNSVGLGLAKYADTTIRITGHTDDRGSRQYNLTLSEKRADSVANYLVTRDVARGRMYIEGAAFDQPVADNGTAAGRAENRRVELYILPKTT